MKTLLFSNLLTWLLLTFGFLFNPGTTYAANPAPPSVSLTDWACYESDGVVFITAYRAGDPQVPFNVNFSTSANGTAVPGVNFLENSGTISFAANQMTQSIRITVLNDGVLSLDPLTFDLRLSNATAGVTITHERALVLIYDSQYPIALDDSFLPDYTPEAFPIAAVQANGELLVVASPTEWGNRGGPDNPNKLVSLSRDGARLREWPTIFTAPILTSEEVSWLHILDNGKVLAAGSFTTVNGVDRPGIVRLTAEGLVDPTFDPAFLSTELHPFDFLYAYTTPVLVSRDGSIVAAIRTENGSRLIKITEQGEADPAFKPFEVVDQNAFKIAEDPTGGILLVNFAAPDSYIRIARLHRDGSLDEAFNPQFETSDGGSPSILDIDIQSDGKILVAGIFSTVNRISRPHLARLNPDGSTDETFIYSATSTYSDISSIYVAPDGTILAGGDDGGLQQLSPNGARIQALPIGLRINHVISSSNGKVLVELWTTDGSTGLGRLLLNPARTGIALDADGRPWISGALGWRISQALECLESAQPITLRVLRLGDVTAAATVSISSREGTAKAGEDFTSINETLNFAPFEQEKDLLLHVNLDSVIEPDETFDLVVVGVSGVERISPPKRVTIHEGRAYFPPNAIKRMSDGQVEVTFYITPFGGSIEGSSDLQTWKSLPGSPDWVSGDLYRQYDPEGESKFRFYRLKSSQ